MNKWPMRTQKAGRRTRRFFILRDDTLSYHRRPPADMEEYIHGDDNYALSSLKLLYNSTCVRGFKRWWPCVVTT